MEIKANEMSASKDIPAQIGLVDEERWRLSLTSEQCQ
jgi:hypothetical protein